MRSIGLREASLRRSTVSLQRAARCSEQKPAALRRLNTSSTVNPFDTANTTLRKDLAAYSDALAMLVSRLPQARALCDQVLKEVRLANALLAFANGPLVHETSAILYRLQNLWPYREAAFARTLGFADEIREADELRQEAERGLKILVRHNDPLAAELSTCLANISSMLAQERALLAECDASIRPHAKNMELTRKRLNLLIAAVDARVPASAEQQSALHAYTATAELLNDWENGVPLDTRGVEILERCLEMLESAGTSHFIVLAPPAA
jgi:hypothetical protein